jgi:hypothetical protein
MYLVQNHFQGFVLLGDWSAGIFLFWESWVWRGKVGGGTFRVGVWVEQGFGGLHDVVICCALLVGKIYPARTISSPQDAGHASPSQPIFMTNLALSKLFKGAIASISKTANCLS